MNPTAVFGIVLGVALARFAAISICAALCFSATDERWLALYYYPAGAIDVVALIALGYWAAVGAGLACLAWNVWQFDLSGFDIAVMLVAAIARGLVALWIFDRLVPRQRDGAWVTPTLNSMLIFSVVYTIVAAAMGLMVLANATPPQSLTQGELVSLVAGTIVGSYGGFLGLNLAVSAYLSSRLKDD